jgi:hypothetical protein
MYKKNIVKALVILGAVLIIILLIHVVGGNMLNMVKSHFGM